MLRWARLTNVPAELREQLQGEGVTLLAERVGVSRSFSRHVPGVYSAAGVARYRGMFAFTAERIVATFPTGANRYLRAIDCRWDAEPGAATATISSAGLAIEMDLPGDISGTMKLNYKRNIADEVLQQLPATTVKYRLEPMFVYRAAGVRPLV